MADQQENEGAKVQADSNIIAVGSLSVAGSIDGSLIIGSHNVVGFTSEQVSALITKISSTFQPRTFDGRCPYRGLEVFQERDAALFFGREVLSKDLISRVKGGYLYHCWKFKNPMGAKIKCEAISGTGEIYLYKNDKKIGFQYQISSNPGPPTVVHLNTGSWGDLGQTGGSFTTSEDTTPLKVARMYGIPVKKLMAANGLTDRNVKLVAGMQLTIPDSEWEIRIKELSPEKNKFRVGLLPYEQPGKMI